MISISLLTLGKALHTLGEVVVAIMVLGVHHRVRHEHTIDDEVFKIMKWEQIGGWIGVVLIVAGFLIEIIFS